MKTHCWRYSCMKYIDDKHCDTRILNSTTVLVNPATRHYPELIPFTFPLWHFISQPNIPTCPSGHVPRDFPTKILYIILMSHNPNQTSRYSSLKRLHYPNNIKFNVYHSIALICNKVAINYHQTQLIILQCGNMFWPNLVLFRPLI